MISLGINECDTLAVCNIPVKEKVTYLGVTIMKDQVMRCSENFDSIKLRRNNRWLQRDLSLKGRVLLTKAEGLSRLTYGTIPLFVNKITCNAIAKLLLDFLWKNKTHYVEKVSCNEYV